jgi:OOP family OmpA-OmpF porin
MLNLLKASLLVLLVCGLALGTLGGCPKKGGEDVTPIPGEDGLEYGKEIDENIWKAPAAVSAEDAAIYETVYFDLDKSELRPETQAVLDGIADDMKAKQGRYLRAVGHCCDRGTNEYNFGLGERRAASVRAYLIELGVDGERVRTLSKGEEEPAVENTDEAARSQNRRVEFWLVP